jgi:sucrose-6F-phosphate phosphohydrolase
MQSAGGVFGFRPRSDFMWTVASDVDGTLTGDRPALDRLAARLAEMRSAGKLYLILSTGRRLDQVLSGISEEGLPQPDAVLGQVGTEIYLAPLRAGMQPMAEWRRRLLRQYSRSEAVSFLEGVDGLEMQPERFNTELKTSCYLDKCPDPQAAADEIRRRVEPRAARYQVIWSSGRDLDILPAASGKGKAIRFLVDRLHLPAEHVVVAGDTGNDTTMFHEFRRGVVVGNAQPELIELAESLGDDNIYLARGKYAAGVAEGLEHFGVLDGRASR